MPSLDSPRQIHLPDLLSACTITASANPHYEKAAAESKAWIMSRGVLPDRKRDFFAQGQIELLSSYAYPYAGYEQLRTACDFINLLFLMDEVSDDQSGVDARETGQVFVNIMKHTAWADESGLAQMVREFKDRYSRLAGPRSTERFNRLSEEYAACLATEAELRESEELPNLERYIYLRRHNSGVALCFSLVEYILGIDLEDEVYDDLDFKTALWSACDHVCWANDLFSYDLERSRGQLGNNAIGVMAKEYNLTAQESADLLGVKCNEFIDTYLRAKANLSAALGPDAARFIEAIGCWTVGNIRWSFESGRYFGQDLQQVKKTGIVVLRPQKITEGQASDVSDEKCCR